MAMRKGVELLVEREREVSWELFLDYMLGNGTQPAKKKLLDKKNEHGRGGKISERKFTNRIQANHRRSK